MSERLELVTNFATLRAGMIVVVKRCKACRRERCRGMSIRLDPAFVDDVTGELVEVGWITLPACKEPDDSGFSNWVGPSAVDERRVYRVVDPGIEHETTTRQRKKAHA